MFVCIILSSSFRLTADHRPGGRAGNISHDLIETLFISWIPENPTVTNSNLNSSMPLIGWGAHVVVLLRFCAPRFGAADASVGA